MYQALCVILIICVALFVWLVFMFKWKGKCRFWKHCNIYREEDDTCNENKGWFYGIGRGGGCYRSLDDEGKLSSYYRE